MSDQRIYSEVSPATWVVTDRDQGTAIAAWLTEHGRKIAAAETTTEDPSTPAPDFIDTWLDTDGVTHTIVTPSSWGQAAHDRAVADAKELWPEA
jgi:hypothetical protein